MTDDEITQEYRETNKDPRFQVECCSHPACAEPATWVGHSGEGTQESIVRWPLCDEHAELWLEHPELCPGPGSFKNVCGYAGYGEDRPFRMSMDPSMDLFRAIDAATTTIVLRFGEDDES